MQTRQTKPKKVHPAQVHIIHSMIYMVQNKMKYEKWMKERDFVEANVWIFEKMGYALKHQYNLDYSLQYSWEAAKLYLEGLE